MNSVSAGSRSIVASRMSAPSTFDTNRNARARSEYWRRASVAIAGPRSEPPMPMLITFRIGLPVNPVHSFVADAHREGGHPIEDRVDVRDDVLTVDDQPLARRRAQAVCRTGPILGRVDALAGEHRRPPLLDARGLGEVHEQVDRVRRSPDASSSRGRSRAPSAIIRPARFGSAANRSRRWTSRSMAWWRARACHSGVVSMAGAACALIAEAYARAMGRRASDGARSLARRVDAARITLSGASGPRISQVDGTRCRGVMNDEISPGLRGDHANRRRRASFS